MALGAFLMPNQNPVDLLPTYLRLGLRPTLKGDPGMPGEAVDREAQTRQEAWA